MHTRPFGLSPRTGQSPYLLITHGEGGSSIGSPGGVVDELIDVSIVGQPVVYGAAFIALLIVAFAWSWADPVLSVVHEGGHMAMSVVTFRGFSHWELTNDGAVTKGVKSSWGPGWFLTAMSGYTAPPVLGLAGAAVLAGGNAWGVLVIAVVLLFGAFYYARGTAANVFVLLVLAGVLLVLGRGSPFLQLTVASAIVWLLLLGGFLDSVRMPRVGNADAAVLARRSFVPALLWQTFFVTVAVVCLYAGGRLLLVGDAWPDGVWPFDVPAEA